MRPLRPPHRSRIISDAPLGYAHDGSKVQRPLAFHFHSEVCSLNTRSGGFFPRYNSLRAPPCAPAPQSWGVGSTEERATLLHECAHWSGAERRLNRDLKHRFGTKAYAAEELIAELTAAFLCARLGIEGELRHAGYIADWIQLLKEDDRAIFTAASKASQAAGYLRQFSEIVPAEEAEQAT